MIQCGLVGENISYSKSHGIFETIYELCGVAGQFVVVDCVADKLAGALAECRVQGFVGLSVTTPHKEIAMSMLTEADEISRAVGATNSLHFANEGVLGYNTDVVGFRDALNASLREFASKRSVLIYGSGGAARAVAYAMLDSFSPTKITIVSRNSVASHSMASSLNARFSREIVSAMAVSDEINAGVRSESVVINCTPCGGPKQLDGSDEFLSAATRRAGAYIDLNYNSNNPYLRTARERGIPSMDGMSMLVRQALASYDIWVGGAPDYESVLNRLARTQLGTAKS